MLNCPGSNGGMAEPSSAARCSVKTSAVSCCTRPTRKTFGSIGSAIGAGAKLSSARHIVEFQQSHAGGLQALEHQLADPQRDRVAEVVILLHLVAKFSRPDGHRLCRLQRHRCEVPAVRREEPRP